MTQEQVNQILRKFFWMLLGLITIGLIVVHQEFRSILIKAITPLGTAFAVAFLVDPVVRLITRKTKLKRNKAIMITLALLILVIIVLVATIIPSLINSFGNLNELIVSENDSEPFTPASLEKLIGIPIAGETLAYIQNALDSALKQISTVLTAGIQAMLASVMAFTSSVASFFVAFIIAIYMLVSKGDLQARIKRVVYSFTKKSTSDYLCHVTNSANDVFSGFFVGKIIDSFIIGVLCWAIMAVFKIPNAFVFSFIIGLTNMIPFFGPIIGAVPCFLITLIINPAKALWVLLIIIGLQQFDGLVLGPKILGDKLGVDAFWIITAVTVGGAIMGVMGMLLGVPIVILVKNLIEEKVEEQLAKKNLSDLCKEQLKV